MPTLILCLFAWLLGAFTILAIAITGPRAKHRRIPGIRRQDRDFPQEYKPHQSH